MTNPFYVDATKSARLSALIVNYDSGQFAFSCARSLRNEWHAAGYEPDRLEIIVVDNCSPSPQNSWLKALQSEGVRVIVGSANVGYAGALQMAFEASQGEDEDYVAILNPDVVFLPGSVSTLIRHLEAHPEVGAVAPRAFADELRNFGLPAFPLASGAAELAELIGGLSPRFARWRAKRRRARNLASWTAEIPIETDMLSGACIFMPRQVAGTFECLMDRRYPLYYEDSDLCRRIAERGLALVEHPRAQILHHWSRSVGSGPSFEAEARRRREISRGAFIERWARPWTRAALSLAEAAVQRAPARLKQRAIHPLTHLVPKDEPMTLRLPGAGPWMFELSMTPTWELSAGSFTEGDTWTFPSTAWAWLFDGRYFLRATEVDTGRLGGAWTFAKSNPARQDAIPVLSVAHPEVHRDGGGDLSRVVQGRVERTGWEQIR